MRSAVVLFSGGIDSTYTVAKSALEYDKLVLVTYAVPGMINEEFSRRSFTQLHKIFGDRLSHHIIDIKDFVNAKRGGPIQCVKDNFKYKFLYAWCLGCKVAMHMYTIKFCRDNKIDCVLEGSNYYDAHALEQHRDVKTLLADIYKTQGITIVTPYYYDESVQFLDKGKVISCLRFLGLHKDPTESRVKYLKTLGIDLGKGVFSQYRGTQPSCLMSLVFNLARLPLKIIFKEQGGCCTFKHGYLNYISDKFFHQDACKGGGACPREIKKTNPSGDQPVVYLDNNATTGVDPEVVKAVMHVQQTYVGNAASSHRLGTQGKEMIDAVRREIAQKINATPEEIVFTAGGTESNNLAIKGMAFAGQKNGRHMIISGIEHPSVSNAALWLKSVGFEVSSVRVDHEGLVDPAEIRAMIRPDTILVSVMQANNEIGTIEPVADIGQVCRDKGVCFHVDAVQSFTKVALDVEKQKIDMLSLSAHKIHGPGGVGALYIRNGVFVVPLLNGGGQENDIRSGTHNVSGIVGFGKAVEIATDDQVKTMAALRDYCIVRLKESFGGIVLNGPEKNRLCNNINILVKGSQGKEIVAQLDKRGIYVSTGAACSSRVLIPSGVLLAIGRSADEALQAIRIGLSKWTAREEIDSFIENLKEVVSQ